MCLEIIFNATSSGGHIICVFYTHLLFVSSPFSEQTSITHYAAAEISYDELLIGPHQNKTNNRSLYGIAPNKN